MNKFFCTNCRYVYNPYLWDEEQDILAWTDFFSLEDSFVCPVCSSSKDEFIEMMQKPNEPWRLGELLPQEEAHIPFYRIEWDRIIVSVGTEDEPFIQDEDHFIEYIWLYDSYGDEIERIDFPDIKNEIEFEMVDEDFEIRASCSIHWVWKWIEIS